MVSLGSTSLQMRRNFGERELSVFLAKIWPPSLILMAVESWGEKQICTKWVRDSKKLGKGLGVNITPIFALPHPFSVNSNSKSNMAG